MCLLAGLQTEYIFEMEHDNVAVKGMMRLFDTGMAWHSVASQGMAWHGTV